MSKHIFGSWKPLLKGCMTTVSRGKACPPRPKVAYTTQSEAAEVAARMESCHPYRYNAYKCSAHGWHVGRESTKPLTGMFNPLDDIELGERVCAHIYTPQTRSYIDKLFQVVARRRGPMATTLLS